jgi:hypothetical protein
MHWGSRLLWQFSNTGNNNSEDARINEVAVTYRYYRTPITTVTTLNIRPQLFPHGATAPSASGPQNYPGFTITLRHNTVGSTSMEKWSARRRYLCLTTHNTDYIRVRQAGFEPGIPASERPQTHALDREATGISTTTTINTQIRGESRK